ncbi:hypothetical protein AIOL_002976 [Candidatus Rhodobacter oscarellae]|uniref:SH3b domain-containing protein n=1 Tax=Candidatus Rhodobacter oscarellae TaxID=1675527 RepID=A0A0J9E5I5_9RHOB|nr:hypothetical protein AIOL_002976 [Candidatus Rhodobacter lobularis]
MNHGCEATTGEAWCQVTPLHGGAKGYVLASSVSPAIGPDGVLPTGVDTSKRRAKSRDFDARSSFPCAQEQGQQMGECAGAVARGGGGDATVVATFPNGFSRLLYFTHGAFMRGNATMSGVGIDTDWSLQDGAYQIRVDDQRFAIPVEFVLGRK